MLSLALWSPILRDQMQMKRFHFPKNVHAFLLDKFFHEKNPLTYAMCSLKRTTQFVSLLLKLKRTFYSSGLLDHLRSPSATYVISLPF
ncbi:hypothetical protein EGR_02648 [Echinococcus granulosus]|uniref:Uncharacterized protein n=1 Tax=Echinococcus granulosus TaxID=6210 RepID=W6UP35_ECHGR|nr:hypothetical protein EGR_02648 [Echinococcus granulosus]EUB62516.1 hypothetical protein EGR_02648 [Echinococcus granulosus]